MTNKKMPKDAYKYFCNTCDFKCIKYSNFVKHNMTRKHEIRTNTNNFVPKNAVEFICDCGKKYKHASSLWNHKQKCNLLIKENKNMDISTSGDCKVDKEFVMTIIKQNNDLQNRVIELLKNGTHNTTNNKNFNLNFFLNETCKNAMNIMDFVNSLQLQLCDLEKMGDIGYVNGMSNIILKSLKDMDVTERPVHCTDKKREILYVKDEGTWDKETDQKPKIRKAIKHIARKNALLLQEFKEKHPDCMKSHSAYSETYDKLIIEAMGGKDYDESQHENKIIKNISQEIIVEK